MSISAKRSLKGSMTSKSELNGGMNIGVVQSHEVDPTVPDWAKQPEKPTYTAEEVGALPADTKIPEVPNIPDWATQPDKPTYTAEEVGAQPIGDYALKSDIPEVPVQSINGKTGAVELTASDVGALPADIVIPVVDDTLTVEGAAADAKAVRTNLETYATLISSNNKLITKAREEVKEVEAKIPDVPETTESDMYLVTDNEGNRTWAKQLAYVRQEEQLLFAETEVAATGTTSITQLIPIKPGDPVTVIFNGTKYSTSVTSAGSFSVVGIGMFIISGVGVNSSFRNMTGQSGTLSVTVITDKYYTVNPNFLPTPSITGKGYRAVILNNYDLAVADGNYSTSVNYGKAKDVAAFAANGGTANKWYSFAIGNNTVTNGYASLAAGLNTIASGKAQHAEGKFNVEDTEEKYAHIIGNGTANDARSNAHTVDWDGNGWFAGTLKVGGTGQDDEAAQEVALKSDIPAPDGVYELIEEYVQSSGGSFVMFQRTQEPDGTPYRFKGIRVSVEFTVGDASVDSFNYNVLLGDSSGNNVYCFDFNPVIPDDLIGQRVKTSLIAFPIFGKWIIFYQDIAPSEKSIPLQTHYMSGEYSTIDAPYFIKTSMLLIGAVTDVSVKIEGVRT